MNDMKLTPQEDVFANKCVELGNNSEAYRYAFPKARKWKDETVWAKASNLYNSDKVQARVQEIQGILQEKSDITKEMVLAEFAKIAFSSIAHLHNTWIERKDFEELTDDQKACIKSIQTKVEKKTNSSESMPIAIDVEYVKIEMYDKIAALININKMLGYEAPQKNDNTIRIDPVARSPLNNLPLDKLDQIQAIIEDDE